METNVYILLKNISFVNRLRTAKPALPYAIQNPESILPFLTDSLLPKTLCTIKVKSLNWKVRKAEFVEKADDIVIAEVQEKLLLLVE